MDSKTRVLTALAHKKPDRAPFNFWMDRRLMAQFEKEVGHRHWRVTHFGADVIETFPYLDFPQGESIMHEGSSWIKGPCFEDWSKIGDLRMPDPKNEKVYELIKQDVAEFPDKFILLDMITPWGVIAGMRTYENIYMDMYTAPDEFKKLSKRILDVMKVTVERACKIGVSALYLLEDLATSSGLAMSPKMIREFCFDYARDMVDIAKSYNLPVLFHSDGSILDLVELLPDLDVKAVNPLQPFLNDFGTFKKRFGDKMAVYGGLDNCFIIPDGTVKDVHDHVIDTWEKLGKQDGALIFSTHDIPIQTPRENVEEMVRTIKEECVY